MLDAAFAWRLLYGFLYSKFNVGEEKLLFIVMFKQVVILICRKAIVQFLFFISISFILTIQKYSNSTGKKNCFS